MRKRTFVIATAGALALLAGAPAAARDYDRNDARVHSRGSAAAQHDARVDPMQLSGWNQAELKSGYSAERLIGMHVRDYSDRSIGEIHDLLMARDGRVSSVIVSAGGVLGIGETFYRVPWQSVRFDGRTNSVSVPISEENVERFRWNAEKVPVATSEVKVSEVMDGNVVLQDGFRYGDVDDLVIGRNGRVEALVVTSSVAGAAPDRYAFPYRGEISFRAGDKAFTLPYTREQVGALRPLDYDRLGIGGTLGLGAEGRVRSDSRTERGSR